MKRQKELLDYIDVKIYSTKLLKSDGGARYL